MSPPTNYIYLATRNLRLLSLVILRRRRNLTPVNPLNLKIKIWILMCWKAYSVSGIVLTPIRYTSALEMGMVQILTFAEIVPKSLFLYNILCATRSFIQYGFCSSAKAIQYAMQCEHCLSESPEMGLF